MQILFLRCTDLVILAMGFVSPEQAIAKQLGLDVDQRNNIHAEYGDFQTSMEGVFAAGNVKCNIPSIKIFEFVKSAQFPSLSFMPVFYFVI